MGIRLLQKKDIQFVVCPVTGQSAKFATFSIVDQDLDLELTEMDQVTVV